MQKELKMVVRISVELIAPPVISERLLVQLRRSSASKSPGRFVVSPSITLSMSAWARWRAP